MNEIAAKQAETIRLWLEEHNGQETKVIEIGEECSWADYLVISTVTSMGHLRGLARELWAVLDSLGLEVNNRHKAVGDDGWELVDCGSIVINLMNAEMRDFYSLEKLWQKMGR